MKKHFSRINAYKIMWLFVFFDLPTKTKKERKAYADFRKKLQKDGFGMLQYSVYTRHCPSRENAEVHIKRVLSNLPHKGQVTIASFTDKQYGDIINYWGRIPEPVPSSPQQLELF
jgi:CRISPR-associated protein Cas2